jgi:predicted trehalose synthase
MDAVSSALDLAARLGMEVVDPQLLRSTNNTVIWLQPIPVVAKVAPRRNGLLEWELVVASALGRMGAPVVPPLELAGSRVHHYGRWAVTFWPYHAQTGVTPDPLALARALERLHDALAEAARREEWSLPGWDRGPQDVITRLGDEGFAPALHADDRTLLAHVLDRSHEIAEMSARQRALHGSPHGYNVLMVDGEPLFIDFETVCHGPVEWDLCHLDPSVAFQYPPGYNVEALGLARLVVSAMTSALCWEGLDRGEDMRSHAEHHLAVVRGTLG